MSTLSLAVRDSSTMLRRNLLHARRYPSLTLNLLLTPVMLLLLFVYIFGDVMSAGIGGEGADRATYIAYIVPGLLMLTIGSTVIGTAVSVSNDMTEGIIARFRTMAIHRGSVLVGHVVGSVLQSVLSVVLVGAVAVAIGFRSVDATPLEWLAAFGLLVLFSAALTWIAVGMGLISPNAEAASNNALPMILLPMLSSAFIRWRRCRAGSGRSPSTSPSPRPSRRCAGCCSAARSATTGGWPWAGASGSWCSATSGPPRSSPRTLGEPVTRWPGSPVTRWPRGPADAAAARAHSERGPLPPFPGAPAAAPGTQPPRGPRRPPDPARTSGPARTHGARHTARTHGAWRTARTAPARAGI